jgi:hypothetical protein
MAKPTRNYSPIEERLSGVQARLLQNSAKFEESSLVGELL